MIHIKDFATATTTNLPSEASEVIVAAAIEQLKKTVGMRDHVFVDDVSEPGADKYIYFTYDDLTAAYDLVQNEDFKYDSAAATSSTKDFVKIAKGFKISFEAKALKRLNIQAAQARACVTEVRDREDYKIIAELASGTSSVTAAGVSSGTSADPVKDISQGVRKIKDLGYVADTILMENTNLEELKSIIGSNDWYAMTEKTVQSGEVPTFMGLKILSTNTTNLAHGTAYIFKSGSQGALQLGQAHDVRTLIFDDNDSHCTKIQVFERICPAIVRPDASATLTGW